MHGAVRKRDIIAHPVTTIRCFGWRAFLRALLASRDRTFLSIVRQTTFATPVAAELSELIAGAIRLELRVMDLYRLLAQRFVDVKPVHEFFADLVRQEESHAELLELCHTSLPPPRRTEKYLDPWREAVVRLGDELPGMERRAEQIGGPEDASRLVIDIESSEINQVFVGIVDASESRFVQAVKAFSSAQQEHIELICRTIPALAPDLTEACQTLREKYQ